VTGGRRLSQAISEGDGISIIALVADPDTARSAEEQGAEGLAVRASAPNLREATGLPILFRVDASPEAASDAGADACLIVVEDHDDEEHLEQLHRRAQDLGLEIVVDVHDEESLADSLERIDPEIFLLSPSDGDDDETPLELVLDLLAAVPAGKLAIADLPVVTPRETLELEQAGCDAVIATSRNIEALAGDLPPDV
jgi:indole-3-glycerol phosphate synthase